MIAELIDYKKEHSEIIMSQRLDDEEFPWQEHAEALEKEGRCVTLIVDDEPALVTGICELWPGVGEAWFMAGNKIYSYPITIARAVKESLHEYIALANFWRIQANVKADWEEAIRFARFCGMKEEGLMPKYGPNGIDYLRMAWVRYDG
jgi:hypothetical protein